MKGIHWWPVNSPNKRPVTRKMFLFDDVMYPLNFILTTEVKSQTANTRIDINYTSIRRESVRSMSKSISIRGSLLSGIKWPYRIAHTVQAFLFILEMGTLSILPIEEYQRRKTYPLVTYKPGSTSICVPNLDAVIFVIVLAKDWIIVICPTISILAQMWRSYV